MSTLVEKQVTKNEFCVKSGYVGSYSFFFFLSLLNYFQAEKVLHLTYLCACWKLTWENVGSLAVKT